MSFNLKMEPMIVQLLKSGKDIHEIINEHKLYTCSHPTHPLIMFCYNNHLSDSDLSHQCRGLILEKDTWKVVCWGFDRFKSTHKVRTTGGSTREDSLPFNPQNNVNKPNSFNIQVKEDGSLIFMFHYANKWHLSTRHTFCDQPSEKIYYDTFLQIIKCDQNEFAIDMGLSIDFTYCFELCSKANRIVRNYPKSCLFLLGALNTYSHKELKTSDLDDIVNKFKNQKNDTMIFRPEIISCSNTLEFAKNMLLEWETKHELFEGFILLDENDAGATRIKLKSNLYKDVHKLRYRGWIKATPELLFPMVVTSIQSNVDRKVEESRISPILSLLHDTRHDYEEFENRWMFLYENVNENIQSLEDIWTNLSSSLLFCELFSKANQKEILNGLKNVDHPLKILLLKSSINQLNSNFKKEILVSINNNSRFVINALFKNTSTSCWFHLESPHSFCEPLKCIGEKCTDENEGITLTPPEFVNNSWKVVCYCGSEMKCLRLKYDYLYYKYCVCGDKVDVLVYPSGKLLWMCMKCDCTHECYQDDNTFHGKKVIKSQPLGFPASKNLKTLRLYVHYIIDGILQEKRYTRSQIYNLIAIDLNLPSEKCHVALLNWSQCISVLNYFHYSFFSKRDEKMKNITK